MKATQLLLNIAELKKAVQRAEDLIKKEGLTIDNAPRLNEIKLEITIALNNVKPYVSKEALAVRTGLHRSTIYRRIEAGELIVSQLGRILNIDKNLEI